MASLTTPLTNDSNQTFNQNIQLIKKQLHELRSLLSGIPSVVSIKQLGRKLKDATCIALNIKNMLKALETMTLISNIESNEKLAYKKLCKEYQEQLHALETVALRVYNKNELRSTNTVTSSAKDTYFNSMNNLYKPSQSTGTNKSHATAQNVTTFPHNSSSSNEMHDKSTELYTEPEYHLLPDYDQEDLQGNSKGANVCLSSSNDFRKKSYDTRVSGFDKSNEYQQVLKDIQEIHQLYQTIASEIDISGQDFDLLESQVNQVKNTTESSLFNLRESKRLTNVSFQVYALLLCLLCLLFITWKII